MAFYKNDIVDINLEDGNIHRSFLSHTIGSGDQSANRFGIRAYRDGVPVDLSGASCQAVFMNAAGTNIALTSYGTVSGNEAYVTLPQACYNVEGQFCLAIKLVQSSVTVTMRIVDGVVSNTGTTGSVAPTSSVPTYQEILDTYAAMTAATAAANTAIAETFDATKAYPAGKYVINSGALYRLTADHAANVTWANTSKVACNFGDETTSLKSAINQKEAFFGIVPSSWIFGDFRENVGFVASNDIILSNPFFVKAGATIFYNFAEDSNTTYRIITSNSEEMTAESFFYMTSALTGEGHITLNTDKYVRFRMGAANNVYKPFPIKLGYQNVLASVSEVENPPYILSTLANNALKFVYVSKSTANTDYNKLMGNLKGNTYTWVDGNWFTDAIPGLQWVFTFAKEREHEGAFAGQFAYIPSTGQIMMRQRVSSLSFDWTDWVFANEDSQWMGKKWFAYGTSLTTEAQGHWVNTTAVALGLVASNKGIGGGALVANRNIYNAIMDTTDGKADADLITFEFGANDRSSPLGTIDSLDNTTILGAANLCIKQLAENCPKAQIVIMPSIPNRYEHQHPDQEHTLNYANPGGWTQDEFYESVRKLAQLNCVHYCPFGSQFAIPFFRSHMKTNGSFDNTYIADQIHPTELGGYNIAQEMIKYLKTIPAWYTSIPT